MKLKALLMCMGVVCPTFAQSTAILIAAGYSTPAPLQVAPGQVMTFFLRNISPLPNGDLRVAQASTVPLPKTLGGLSLRISQGQSAAVDVPIFAVRQENDCDNSANNSACLLTLVKVQIPFEITAPAQEPVGSGPPLPPLPPAPLAQFIVNVDGQPSRVFPLQPVPDNGHVLTSCDIAWDTKSTSVCGRQAYHANGHPITGSEPAMPGETITVYIFGLGQPSGAVATGDVSPSGTPLTGFSGRVRALFDNFVNAPSYLARFPGADEAPSLASPYVLSPIAFDGLTPGQIGMYQLNTPVPQSLQLAGPCGGLNGFIQTNATLHIGTPMGTELIAICVQP